MSLLLEAIEERQLLGINPNDNNNLADYLDYAVDNTKQVQAIVLPSGWLNNSKHIKRKTLLEINITQKKNK